jgi:hypothetical protein
MGNTFLIILLIRSCPFEEREMILAEKGCAMWPVSIAALEAEEYAATKMERAV